MPGWMRQDVKSRLVNIPIEMPEAPEFTVNQLLNQAMVKARKPGFDYAGALDVAGGILNPQQQQQMDIAQVTPGRGPGQVPQLDPNMMSAPGSPAQALPPAALPVAQQGNFSTAPGGGAQMGPTPMMQMAGATGQMPQQMLPPGPTGPKPGIQVGQRVPRVGPMQMPGMSPSAAVTAQPTRARAVPTQTPNAPPAVAQAQQGQPQQQPGLLQRIFGGAGRGMASAFGGKPSGLLTPEQRSAAGWEALRDAGLGMIQASAPTPWGTPPATGPEVFGAALQAGTQGYQGASQRQREEAGQLAIRDALQPGATLETVQEAYGKAVAAGAYDAAKTISPVLQSMLGASGADNLAIRELPNGDLLFLDPKTGEERGSYDYKPGAQPLTPQEQQIVLGHFRNFNEVTSAEQEVPRQVRRVFAPTNRLIAAITAGVSREEKKHLALAAVSAFSAYARTIDPGSVVRSEEMKLLMGEGDLVTKLESLFRRWTEGTVADELAYALQAEARAQLLAQAPSFYEMRDAYYKQLEALGYEREQLILPDPYTSLIEAFYNPDGTLKATNDIGFITSIYPEAEGKPIQIRTHEGTIDISPGGGVRRTANRVNRERGEQN